MTTVIDVPGLVRGLLDYAEEHEYLPSVEYLNTSVLEISTDEIVREAVTDGVWASVLADQIIEVWFPYHEHLLPKKKQEITKTVRDLVIASGFPEAGF